MPVRIRLSRAGAKKRPFYRIVVADSRRSRDGKFIERIGSYNPMLKKDNLERVKINLDRAKYWLSKGAKPSDRVIIFLSNMGILEKPVITEKTISHIPKAERKNKDDKSKLAEVKADAAPATTAEAAKPAEVKADAAPATTAEAAKPQELLNEKK